MERKDHATEIQRYRSSLRQQIHPEIAEVSLRPDVLLEDVSGLKRNRGAADAQAQFGYEDRIQVEGAARDRLVHFSGTAGPSNQVCEIGRKARVQIRLYGAGVEREFQQIGASFTCTACRRSNHRCASSARIFGRHGARQETAQPYEKGRGAAAPRQFSVTSLRISSTTTTSTRPLAGLRSSPRRRSAFGSGSPVDASCCRSRCDAASPIDIPARMVRAS
jgi:hypothetical protein